MIFKPEVSVIMGTFNPKKTQLINAVNSIINQTYTNWELIICDDGSDDDIKCEIISVTTMDKRITLIRSEDNKGLAHALNLCLAQAHGRYIARMDDDDVSMPDRLKKQIDFLSEHKEYSWVGCTASLYDEKGIWGQGSRPEKPDAKDFLHFSPFIHSSTVFRKEALLEAGGYRESELTSRCEDYDLFMRMYISGNRGYNIQENLLLYYENSEGTAKRSMRFCYYEMLVRFDMFRRMGLMSPGGIPYIFKPIVVGIASLFPKTFQMLRKRRNYGNHGI